MEPPRVKSLLGETMPRRCRINHVMNLRENADQKLSAVTDIDELFLRRRLAPANGRLSPRADGAFDSNV